jgi:hypothetical protein
MAKTEIPAHGRRGFGEPLRYVNIDDDSYEGWLSTTESQTEEPSVQARPAGKTAWLALDKFSDLTVILLDGTIRHFHG